VIVAARDEYMELRFACSLASEIVKHAFGLG
jgi:hypothetical protein